MDAKHEGGCGCECQQCETGYHCGRTWTGCYYFEEDDESDEEDD